MVSLYDTALINKIKSWTEDTNIYIYGPNDATTLFSLLADENNDSALQLPIIVVKRDGAYELLNSAKVPPTFSGHKILYNNDMGATLNCLPIKISYQIDVYTRYFLEADIYMRDLIFNIVNHPTIKVLIPYNNMNIEHDFNMKLMPQVQDNSDIPEAIISGGFTRFTIAIDIEDAYLWSIPIHSTIKIEQDGIWVEPNNNIVEREQVYINN